MSITINGATNTLTAASGLTIAGNTAVTGTLSATGNITGDTNLLLPVATAAIGFGPGATEQLYRVGNALRAYANGADVAAFSASGLAVTGTLSATKNTDGEQAFTVLNNSAGTSAYSIAQVTNGTTALQLFHTGTGFTPSGIYPTDGTVISGTGSGGLTLNAGYAGASLSLLTQGVARAAFSSTGLTLGTGVNLVMASGQGIDFSATANGSGTTTSEVLSDYEEGTFTPTVIGTSTAGTGTYNTRTGIYTKVGRLVTVNIYVALSNHTGTGNIRIQGLPFTVAASDYGVASLRVTDLALTAGNYPQSFVTSTDVYLEQVPTGGGTAAAIPMDTACEIILTCTYST